jgi:ATP-dependent Clp protease ATP-binding subunit ClpC
MGAHMDSIVLNRQSIRAQKARIGEIIVKWKPLISISVYICLFAALVFIVIGQPLGWLLLGLSAVPIIVLEWWKGDVHHLKPSAPSSIDGILAGDVLGKLPKDASPRDLAAIVSRVPSGQFFAARFGIGARFLQEIASDKPADSEVIWRDALSLMEQMDAKQISGGILLVALVRSFEQHETVLAHLQIGVDDLINGVKWYEHIHDLIRQSKKPRRTGGVARDWSFGYIPLLSQYGQNISEQFSAGGALNVQLEAHTQALDQLIATFSSAGRQNATLVGPAGVGKTTIVHAFAERLLDASSSLSPSLKFRQVIMLDASALIAAAPGRGELEQLVMRILNEAYSAKNVILCLDNAQLFFEEGVGSVDLSNVLLPILEAGRLRIILTMDEQRYLQIGQRNPALINALNRISVASATERETLAVLQDQLIVLEFQHHVTFMYQALEEAYRLSERYVHDLAMPGRAMKLLESAASHAEDGLVTAHSVQRAIEQTMDIKVGVANTDDEREKLLNLEELIHKRMINQTRAVQVVSDALRRARAGVRNQNRPIGTFLFLGPTGVGKTELAKALADVYFGGEDRIIRLDLNEYVRADDVARLIADGADDPGSLTARAMKQPFSVVLLDEIEKAHPQVLTTLLQLLDEGILRDMKNREVSFRDAIVIATSNAGADRIREYIERGYQLEQFEKQFVDELINTNQFRPEFLNRFDEIVTFRPLGKEELIQVVDLILAGINKTLALQKLTVMVEDDAKLYLVESGYDPRLGARPMRRVVQRAVENTVAKQVLSGSALPGATITITLDQVKQILDSQQQADGIAMPETAPSSRQ